MDINKLFDDFKEKCSTIRGFTRTKYGRRLFLAACAVFILLFFAPLFHGSVGAAIMACVAAPYVVLLWRKYDKQHAVVPAVFLCIPMVLDMLFYHSLVIASIMLVAALCTLMSALTPSFRFYDKLRDTMYAFLWAGAICVGIVVVASLVTLLVSIAWWLFCLVAFVAIVAVFFSVVLSTAAYTATDDRRQAKKRRAADNEAHISADYTDIDDEPYNVQDFEEDSDDNVQRVTVEVRKSDSPKYESKSNRNSKSEPLYYDVD